MEKAGVIGNGCGLPIRFMEVCGGKNQFALIRVKRHLLGVSSYCDGGDAVEVASLRLVCCSVGCSYVILKIIFIFKTVLQKYVISQFTLLTTLETWIEKWEHCDPPLICCE